MKTQESINAIDCLSRLMDAVTRSRGNVEDLNDAVKVKLLELVNSL